jgi:hypothetical protein
MTKKAKEIEVVVVSFEEYAQDDFNFPSKFMIKHWSGNYHFYKTSKRELAQAAVDAEYGANKYSIRVV